MASVLPTVLSLASRQILQGSIAKYVASASPSVVSKLKDLLITSIGTAGATAALSTVFNDKKQPPPVQRAAVEAIVAVGGDVMLMAGQNAYLRDFIVSLQLDRINVILENDKLAKSNVTVVPLVTVEVLAAHVNNVTAITQVLRLLNLSRASDLLTIASLLNRINSDIVDQFNVTKGLA